MRRYARTFLVVSLLLAAYEPARSQAEKKSGCEESQQFPVVAAAHRAFTQIEIPIEINREFKNILVRGKINGRLATFILDTGSSHTILSSEFLEIHPPALEQAGATAKGSGFVGKASWTKATVEIGTMVWTNRRVLVMDELQGDADILDVLRLINEEVIQVGNQALQGGALGSQAPLVIKIIAVEDFPGPGDCRHDLPQKGRLPDLAGSEEHDDLLVRDDRVMELRLERTVEHIRILLNMRITIHEFILSI